MRRPSIFELLPAPVSARAAGAIADRVLRRARESAGAAGIVLLYHVIAEPEAATIVPTVPPGLFEEQLGVLERDFDVVELDELLDRARSRRPGEAIPVAVTLDDDHPAHLGTALPILRAHEVPATFFLNGRSLRSAGDLWWQRLQRVIDGRRPRPTQATVRALAQELEPLTPPERELRLAQLGAAPGRSPLTESEIRELAAAAGIGFHTLEHPSLVTLAGDALRDALADGRAELERVVGRPVDLLAYPHGHHDENVRAAVGEARYRYAFTTGWEPVTADTDPLAIGRVEPGAVPVELFRWRLARTLQASRRRAR